MALSSQPVVLPWSDAAPTEVDVAVVGGGFAGLMAMVHLCRAMPHARIAVFERRPRPAPGVAYGGCDAEHLLNVPAARMGAFPSEPGAFHAWLGERFPGRWGAEDFAPRALFGAYLSQLVAHELATTGAQVCLVRDAVSHLEPLHAGMELLLASGRTCVTRAVLLGPGLPPARAPWARVDHGVARAALAADPWEPRAMQGLDPHAPVVVLGSGLTALDVALGLRRAGHQGRIRMVSRNGRLPLPHAAPGEAARSLPLDAFAGGPRAVLHVLRRAAQERMATGLGWQGALDAIRPHVTAIWRAWTPAQRRQFMRHARAMWEIHRHRAPRPVLEEVERQLRAGTLVLERGEVVGLLPATDGAMDVSVRAPDGAVRTHRAARIFNCVGPAMGVRESIDPLIGSLLRSGLAVTDELGMGIRTDDDGMLAGGTGAPLWLVGALRRGDLWESTAVPELRVQAERAAASIAARIGAGAARHAGAQGGPGTHLPVGCG
jgi:uncharacterized NAD(P)/FAD-binding protein YdhS